MTGELDERAPSQNILEQSKLITRGDCRDIKELDPSEFDYLLVPGGFGVGKHLTNFATMKDKFEVNSEVEEVVKKFHASKKPMGFTCISPIIPAYVIKNCKITMGLETAEWPYKQSIDFVKKLGATHQNCDVP